MEEKQSQDWAHNHTGLGKENNPMQSGEMNCTKALLEEAIVSSGLETDR